MWQEYLMSYSFNLREYLSQCLCVCKCLSGIDIHCWFNNSLTFDLHTHQGLMVSLFPFISKMYYSQPDADGVRKFSCVILTKCVSPY